MSGKNIIVPTSTALWTECHQGDDKWKAVRLGKVTGSRFGDVMTKGRAGESFGKTAETYAIDIIAERLTGKPRDEIHAKEMEWGKKHENGARLAYCLLTNQRVDQVGFATHGKYRDIGASVDGLVGLDGIIEIKCPFNPKYHLLNLIHNKVPKDYQYQVQGGLWILDRKWCDFVSYDPRMPERLRLAVTRVYRDEKLIEALQEKCLAFLGYIREYEAKIDAAEERVQKFLEAPTQERLTNG